MNNDIISRAELEKELLKEYSQVLSDREKHPEERDITGRSKN